MQPALESVHVAAFPRDPFLPHSEELLKYLLGFAPGPGQHVLEIGCGPRSPLLLMLQRLWPSADIHQIDALPEVVAEAAKFNPGGRVERMLASNMAAIPARSKQLVVAMSVFDQNPESIVAEIAEEVRRVLCDNGIAVYLHNEELNLPATAVSMLQHSSGPRLLLPSNSWKPTNDLEYCSGSKSDIEAALAGQGPELHPLQRYLRGIFPQLFGTRPVQSAEGKVEVPFLRECTFPVMSQIRRSVAALRQEWGVSLLDHRTPHLLHGHVERLFCQSHGFRILRSGVFELRRCTHWSASFLDRPPTPYFVRGITRFGYSSRFGPAPVTEYEQDLNRNPSKRDDDILWIGYQYGVVATKI